MNAPLVQQLNLRFRDVPPQVVIASAIILGLEVDALRIAGGYSRGSWWRYRDDGGRRTPWKNRILQVAGICDITARNYYFASVALFARLEAESENGTEHAELLETMRRQPSTLTADERSALVDGIAGALHENDSIKGLAAEGRALHAKGNADDPPPAGEAVKDIPETPPSAWEGVELMALNLGIAPDRARIIAMEVLDLLGDGSRYGKRKKHGKGRK